MKALQVVGIAIQAAGQFVPFVSRVAALVGEKLADGEISVDEATDLAIDLVESEGVDLKIKIKGVDVIDDEAEAMLAAAAARIIANAIAAARG